MRQWHCTVGGQVYGPASEEELGAWIAQGRLTATDFVWTEGMAEWAPVGQVFPGGSAGGLPGPPVIDLSMVSAHAPGGTGGQTPNAVLTAQARDCLRGRWNQPVAFCLLLALLHMAAGLASMCVPVNLVVTGPFMLAGCIYFLTLTRGGQGDTDMLFVGFKNFGNALGAYILMYIFITLWMLLLFVPGIVAAMGYSQTFYLLAGDRTLGPLEALRKSKQMMVGHKWRYFCLNLRFVGWILLCELSCGIGFLWLMPYMAAAQARFHDDLCPPRAPVAIAAA